MVNKFTKIMRIFFFDILIYVIIIIVLVIKSLALVNIFAVVSQRREHDIIMYKINNN